MLHSSGTIFLPFPRSVVWNSINDPEILRRSIPGCTHLERIGEDELAATVKIQIGVIKATFKGKVMLDVVDEGGSYRISGKGDGGIVGMASGSASVSLEDADSGATTLSYQTESNVTGKIAQLGARLLDGVSKKLTKQFFENLSNEIANDQASQNSQIFPGTKVINS